jgi:hypothetical protein
MRPALFFRTLLILFLAGYSTVSCDNEFDTQSPDYKSIPVVYGILELHRDTLCVRVTKTFAGSGSAYTSARIEDSVYFPAARVWLEKWNGDFRVNKAELTRTNLNSRVSGIFSERPNWNYILLRSPETETIFTGSVQNQEYHLSIEIPGLPLIFAKTTAYPSARLNLPRLSGTVNLFLNPLEFSLKTEAPYSELYFQLFYSDVYADTTIARCATWREYHKTKPTDPSSDFVYGNDLMKRIAGQISPDRKVSYRRVSRLEAVVVGIPADLYDYRLMVQVQPPDQGGFAITNIVNGTGLFTSQTINSYVLDPDPRTRDSIMNSQYTKHLNLKYY